MLTPEQIRNTHTIEQIQYKLLQEQKIAEAFSQGHSIITIDKIKELVSKETGFSSVMDFLNAKPTLQLEAGENIRLLRVVYLAFNGYHAHY